MKKLFLTMVIALMSTAMSFGQNTLVATLDHNGEISVHYGSGALIQAYDNANPGDVVTLSSGTFQTPIFTKAITVRGAGMQYDEVLDRDYTYLVGQPDYNGSRIQIEGDSLLKGTEDLIFEGLRFGELGRRGRGYNSYEMSTRICKTQFIKCYFTTSFTHFYDDSEFTMVNCRLRLGTSGYCDNLTLINCLVNDVPQKGIFMNCVFDGGVSQDATASYENCCFIASSTDALPITATVRNCVSTRSNTFINLPNSTNKYVEIQNLFKTATSGEMYSESENYELTDEAKTLYLGTDGTQVGIYGGLAPYNATPSNPQITKFNVAQKATADGKLSVDITVNGAE